MTREDGHSYLRSHQVSGDVMQMDLGAERASILDAARSAPVGHTAKTLVKDGPIRVVLVGLRSGATLREHKAEGPVTIQALEGEAVVSAGNETETLGVGSLLVFGPEMPHTLDASSDCVLLLTIAMSTAA
jgi:quercetin dioxygenase-like cupin family protein